MDRNGKINIQKFYLWNANESNIVQLIQLCINAFSKQFPLVEHMDYDNSNEDSEESEEDSEDDSKNDSEEDSEEGFDEDSEEVSEKNTEENSETESEEEAFEEEDSENPHSLESKMDKGTFLPDNLQGLIKYIVVVIDRTWALSETNRTELFGHSLPETTELNQTEL